MNIKTLEEFVKKTEQDLTILRVDDDYPVDYHRGASRVIELFKDFIDECNDEDVVNNPSHYNRKAAMECLDEMEMVFGKEALYDFCVLNAWKYRYRAMNKNGEEDIAKSDFYMNKAKELKE